MTVDLILGTAGHIDHGKTSLIRALTGTDTDRLPEEKKRGITIELGFARLQLGEYQLGIVDVPGHERFVRNMLAGATGMDLALLVVAADDSVKPQTEEHLEILRMLDLEEGAIAVTKSDLVDPDWLDLVADEIRETVSGTFLERAPLVYTSASTGQGLDELRQCLLAASERVAASGRLNRRHGPFRMAIDRTFTIAGHGTVVTGSVSSGSVQVGDELMIEPGSIPVRVRGLQNHEDQVERVQRGQRAAINLAGIHHETVQRGQELASPGHLLPSKLLTLSLQQLPEAARPLKDRARVRLHIGTAEVLASIRLLDRERLEPGDACIAQAFLSEPCVAVWNQPFVVRSESPVATIGGGRILDSNAQRIRRPDEEVLTVLGNLKSKDEVERAGAALYLAGLEDWDPRELPRTAGVDQVEAVCEQLRERGDLLEFTLSPQRSFRCHRLIFQHLCRRVATVLDRLHELHPLHTGFERTTLANRLRYLPHEVLLKEALRQMRADNLINLSDRGVSLVGRGPRLSQSERKLMRTLIEQLREAGFEAPSVKKCTQNAAKNQDSVPNLLALAAAQGDLVEINSEYFLHSEVEQQQRQLLAEHLAGSDGLTLSEIREILNTSRKFAVPFCEYLDRIGFTERRGDVRVLSQTQ